MDALTMFGIGVTIYTALNFIPARSDLKQDEVITETFKQLGIQNKYTPLLPELQLSVSRQQYPRQQEAY